MDRICNKHGCGEIVDKGRCEKHQRENKGYGERKKYIKRDFYDSKVWKRLRKKILARDPICRICGDNESQEVDHIVPIRDGGAKLHAENLQGVCKKCHSRKSAEEVEGFGDNNQEQTYRYEHQEDNGDYDIDNLLS